MNAVSTEVTARSVYIREQQPTPGGYESRRELDQE
ncbi:MAG: hypothetical protein KatS3mg008_0844 [Acidimicrobiales bacterium]|nr:MAG: hypothetical protein KatS3mg008_0844 [Acidimicrobiales bacterium]